MVAVLVAANNNNNRARMMEHTVDDDADPPQMARSIATWELTPNSSLPPGAPVRQVSNISSILRRVGGST
jgi:hypothetical protein